MHTTDCRPAVYIFLFLRPVEDVHQDEDLRLAKYINAFSTGTTIIQGFVQDHETPSQYIQLIARLAAAVMSVLWSSSEISKCSTQQLVDLTTIPKHPGTPKHQ
jgi:hypothetical protein